MLELHIRNRLPTLLVGTTGTGKSFYMQKMLMHKLDLNKFSPAFLTFTTSISANLTQVVVILVHIFACNPLTGEFLKELCMYKIEFIYFFCVLATLISLPTKINGKLKKKLLSAMLKVYLV